MEPIAGRSAAEGKRLKAQPISIVIPSLFDTKQLERSLPPLIQETEERAAGDQILIVDDTGNNLLAPWAKEEFPGVQVHALPKNTGFAAALTAGIEACEHELVFCMNPDVVVREGFLAPLVEAIQPADVHSVVPRILLMGDEERIESINSFQFTHGLSAISQPALQGRAKAFRHEETTVPFAVGGAMLLQRSEFLEGAGFDPLFAPFYWEDVDLGWMAWRAGKRVIYVPEAVVEHHHRGTIKSRVQADLVRAMIEKNRLLFQWKHLDDDEAIEAHLRALHRWAIDAWIGDERQELIWLALALEQQQEVEETRSRLPEAALGFLEICERSAPSEG